MSPPTRDFSPQRRRRRNRRRHQSKRRRRVLVLIALAVVAIAIPASLAVAGFGAASAFSNCSLSSLQPVAIGQNSFIYAADGTLLGAIPAERNRQPVPFLRVSPWFRKATVAIEDRRFWQHGGIDYEGIVRALWKNAEAGETVEGGSTITQQLVRNLWNVSRERTLDRKVKEACFAIKLDRRWSKRRVLTAYMNQVYYGNHAYGIEAAAQTYFSKHARELTLLESALLAGLPQAPSRFDPFNNRPAALARRDAVLRAMLKNRTITRGQLERAIARRDLGLKAGRLYTQIREPYFFSYVRDELLAQYGAETVRSGGLRVYTTIDPAFQKYARQAITDTLYERTDPAAAVVSINPDNGA
ncbi:MAG: penicillin-binding protein, partial [Actinobacteria bacterium]|nr:penicillin-binding protein [Actinomycetota bacterium]